MRMTARETMCAARDAVQFLRDAPAKMEAKRSLCEMRARSNEPRGRGGVADPTKRIDDLIQCEQSLEEDYKSAERLVSDAYALLQGLAQIDAEGAKVLLCRFLLCMPWRDVAVQIGVGAEECREIASVAFDIIDSNGEAAIRNGVLAVTRADG